MVMQLKNIDKSYGDNQILKNCNLLLEYRGLYFIKGESGCGKTTLLNIIAGYEDFDRGKRIVDKDIHISMIFQNFELINELSVRDNINIYQYLYYKDNQNQGIIEDLGLEEFLDYYPQELSYGQQQRVAIARSLIHANDIILCDEPTESLDKKNRHIVMCLLKKLSQQCIVVVVSHDEELLDEYADISYEIKDNHLKLLNVKHKNQLHIPIRKDEIDKRRLFHLMRKLVLKINRYYYVVSILFLVMSSIGFSLYSRFVNQQSGTLNDHTIYRKITRWGQTPSVLENPLIIRQQYHFSNQLLVDNETIRTSIISLPSVHKDLPLVEGHYGQGIIINQFLANELQKIYQKDSLIGEILNLEFKIESVFEHTFALPIVAIVEENTDMNMSQLYYPYEIIDSYLQSQFCVYDGEKMSVKEVYRREYASDYEIIYDLDQDVIDIYQRMKKQNMNCYNVVLDAMSLNQYQQELIQLIILIVMIIFIVFYQIMSYIVLVFESKKQVRYLSIIHSLSIDMNNLKKYDFIIHIIEYAIVIVVGFILNVCLYSLIKIIFDLSNSDIIKNMMIGFMISLISLIVYVISLSITRKSIYKNNFIVNIKED